MCHAALARWPRLSGEDSDVEVVHAMSDPFCPSSQVAAYRQAGLVVNEMSDAHTLDSPRTIELIVAVALALCSREPREARSLSRRRTAPRVAVQSLGLHGRAQR
jgi:hypothetical protein